MQDSLGVQLEVVGSQSQVQEVDETLKGQLTKAPEPKVERLEFCTLFYDTITILISIADVITDFAVLVHYYESKRTTPFYCSLFILIAAQLSYVLAFLSRFTDSEFDYWRGQRTLKLLFCILPIAPLLSFVIYYASFPGSRLAAWLKANHFIVETVGKRKNQSKIEHFIDDKLVKHMGFILEAAVESFPQSILQMAVMVHYDETNWLSVVSILLSLISVCTKSLVFSFAVDIRTFVFNYVSIVTDFVSAFALISWLFYDPNGNGMSQLRWFYIYKVAFTTVPFVSFGGFLLWSGGVLQSFPTERDTGARHPKLQWAANSVLLFVVCALGSVFGSLMAELCCFCGVAFLTYFLSSNRFKSGGGKGIFWGKCFAFISSGANWNDKLLRVILITENVLKDVKDFSLKQYLEDNRQSTYGTVTWKGLREHSHESNYKTPLKLLRTLHAEAWKFQKANTSYLLSLNEIKTKWREYDGHYNVPRDVCSWPMGLLLAYVMFPVYVFCRFVNVSFVWLLVATTKFEDIAPLQFGMAVLLGALQLTWLLSFALVLRLHYATWHIFAGHSWLFLDCHTENRARERWTHVAQMHNAHTCEPFRRQAVVDYFGPDIGSVVLEFLPSMLVEMEQRSRVT